MLKSPEGLCRLVCVVISRSKGQMSVDIGNGDEL